MSDVVDLVVAGGGPAGLAAAILAARAGMDVVVIEPREGVLDKACGEGIMPGGVEALADLGVSPSGAAIIGICYCDAVDASIHAVGTFPRGIGRGVKRTALHEALLERARAHGVRLRAGRVDAFEQRAGQLRVNGLRARWLIGADGLHSQVRRILGVEAPPRLPRRFGARRHWAAPPWSGRVEVYFAPGAEAYVTPVADDTVEVAFLFEPPDHYEALLERFPLVARRLRGRAPSSRLLGAGPFEQRVRRRSVGDVLLIGDAAGYLDPITGEGVALGIATAAAAIESLLEGRPGAYERRYHELTSRYFALTSTLLAVVRRPALHRPLLHLARAWPNVFDAALGVLGHLDHGASIGA